MKRVDSDLTTASAALVDTLQERERLLKRRQRQCLLITAILQALSPHRPEDASLTFSLRPEEGEGLRQFRMAILQACRLSALPRQIRACVWLALADHYLQQMAVDFQQLRETLAKSSSAAEHEFDELEEQIEKDLHRTGYSEFNSATRLDERAALQRVLRAYAHWNPLVNYVQGFNTIVAVVLQVVSGREFEALKVSRIKRTANEVV